MSIQTCSQTAKEVMEHDLKILEDMWIYYFSSLNIEPHEYDIYGKIIGKIKNKDFEFTEDDKNNMSELINVLRFVCDEYEMKILDRITN